MALNDTSSANTSTAQAVAAANAANTTSGTKSTASTKNTIAGNFDQFLKLLTTQLQNQNPLEPLNTNDFTQQLVQFASVEQQIKSNETLTALLTSAKATTLSNAASFIGADVTADGSSSSLSGGKGGSWVLTFPRAAAAAQITIKDKSGSVVATESRSFDTGSQLYTWNGRTSTGLPAPDGDYSISVNARDQSGQPLSVATEISGVVNGIDLTGTSPVLLIGDTRIPMENVKSIRRNNG